MTSLESTLKTFDRDVERGSFDTGRYRCRYLSLGEGPPLVIIHGLADQARSFALLMAALSSELRCIAYELPVGREDGAALGRYRLEDYTADLFALLDHLALDRTVLLGSSFGSPIALRAMTDSPGRFTHGILQGGFARRPLRWHERRVALLARYLPGRMGSVPGRPRLMAKLERPSFIDAPPGAYEFLQECSGATPLRAAARRAILLHRLDLLNQAPLVRVPILMIGGDRDAIVPRMREEELLARLPVARRVEIARCGHYPHYTHSVRMADEIRAFLGNGSKVPS